MSIKVLWWIQEVVIRIHSVYINRIFVKVLNLFLNFLKLLLLTQFLIFKSYFTLVGYRTRANLFILGLILNCTRFGI